MEARVWLIVPEGESFMVGRHGSSCPEWKSRDLQPQTKSKKTLNSK